MLISNTTKVAPKGSTLLVNFVKMLVGYLENSQVEKCCHALIYLNNYVMSVNTSNWLILSGIVLV